MASETEVGELLRRRGWRAAYTVAERVHAWAALVSDIECGYDDDIDEYTNDLYCRNWLHEAWLLLDEHVVQLWTPRIRALDDRYTAATVDDDGQALDQFHRLPGPDLWWWRRHPRILTGELGRSLRSAGAVGTAHADDIDDIGWCRTRRGGGAPAGPGPSPSVRWPAG
ncbi:hypothetical protein [Streptomyces sp. NPDC056387]|uniref:hypothetical protein n=1 Tax=Streptomyces sp. NPDC056387 TaxID=3345803 RepID=UPI0035E29E5B